MENSSKFGHTISALNSLKPQLDDVKYQVDSLINQRQYFIKGTAGRDMTNKLYELQSCIATASSRLDNQVDSLRSQESYYERQEEIRRQEEREEARRRQEEREAERRESMERMLDIK